MRKKHLQLLAEQKTRGVIFSSQLLPNGTLHEIYKDDPDAERRIALLKDDKFFNNSPYKYNLVRE